MQRLSIALAGLILAQLARGQGVPVLQLQGQPYSDGAMTLHFFGTVGQPTLLLYGLDPLDPPVQTPKGAFHIGTVFNGFSLGAIPSLGRIDMPFSMPPLDPVLAGIPIVMQGLVPGALSNPATLPLDQPYLLPRNAITIDHPVPSQQALFGDTVEAGDFNGDGVMDLAVGAWFEDVAGVDKAGRVYVMWGPDFDTWMALEPVVPKLMLHFGGGLAVADFDGDGVDDLAVGEASGGDPPTPGAHGHIYVFRGAPVFSQAPWVTITSFGNGLQASLFGRLTRAGDINGDDHPDLVVGVSNTQVHGFAKAGGLEVFYGPDFVVAQLVVNPEPKTNDFFGSRLSLGDVTGDGVLDIIEASGRASTGGLSQVGRLHVYDGPTLSLLHTIENPQPAAGDRFGEGLHAADLDGDGLDEIIAADVKKTFYIVWDALAGAPIAAWPKPPSPNPLPGATSFGYFFASMDANQDGLPDVVIADPFEGDVAGCFVGGGTVYVALAPYYATFLRLANPFGACGDDFSWNLIVADLDGDGVKELISGDETADTGGISNAGRVVIVRL